MATDHEIANYDLVPKLMPADALGKLLLTLPAGHSLQTNQMGNLVILDETQAYVGYIDMGSGEVHWDHPS